MSHETLTPNPEQAKELRYWRMETQPDHPETYDELVLRFSDRVDDGPVNTKEAELTATRESLKFQDTRKGWWLNLDKVKEELSDDLFETKMPTEQFIVGQGEKGVRFYNFGEPLDKGHQEDLRKFVDVATQYMGDRAYDLLQDVIITDFAKRKAETLVEDDTSGEADEYDEKEKKETSLGFTHPALGEVLFINSKVLNRETSDRENLDASRLLQTLTHEFGHLVHGFDDQARDELHEFAEAIGWDFDKMLSDALLGKVSDPADYRPSSVYGAEGSTAIAADGTKKRMILDKYSSLASQGDDSVQSTKFLGSPTEYGTKSPDESSADTSKHAMLGSILVNHLMPHTRDAWLTHMEKRRGGPITAPLRHKPIALERRTESDILYPRTKLPGVINDH